MYLDGVHFWTRRLSVGQRCRRGFFLSFCLLLFYFLCSSSRDQLVEPCCFGLSQSVYSKHWLGSWQKRYIFGFISSHAGDRRDRETWVGRRTRRIVLVGNKYQTANRDTDFRALHTDTFFCTYMQDINCSFKIYRTIACRNCQVNDVYVGFPCGVTVSISCVSQSGMALMAQKSRWHMSSFIITNCS